MKMVTVTAPEEVWIELLDLDVDDLNGHPDVESYVQNLLHPQED
jgi:hypothetical protein